MDSMSASSPMPLHRDVVPSEPASHAEHAAELYDHARNLLREKNAVLVAHYYTAPLLQQLADETGGCVSDSLEMARFGTTHPAKTLLVAGVRFMGETAKILNPEKRVLVPTAEATCSLDEGCPPDEFARFIDRHPDHTVVVYANTSAAVKALSDWVVTSSIAVPLIEHLHRQGKPILWAPDRHLGNYLQRTTGADMVLWNGACIVHNEFKARELRRLKAVFPEAAVLVHPESPQSVIALADVVGSTSALIKAARQLDHPQLIVATDKGIFYKMRQAAPHKEIIEAPTSGVGATCKSCAECPWMALNDLHGVIKALENGEDEIDIPADIRNQALRPLQRMLDFAETLRTPVYGQSRA